MNTPICIPKPFVAGLSSILYALGMHLEMFCIRNKSLLAKQAAQEPDQGTWGTSSSCTCRMTLNYNGSNCYSQVQRECSVRQRLPWASLLPEIARGKMSCSARKEGATFLDYYKASVLFVWLMSPHFRRSHLMHLSLLTTSPLVCCWLFLRFMRPNSQAMCVWIKGTWESLFLSDPRKFPVSCLSEAPAESMMGRWSLLSPGKIRSLLSFRFN